jgi:hypothetical protein
MSYPSLSFWFYSGVLDAAKLTGLLNVPVEKPFFAKSNTILICSILKNWG